MKYALRVRLPGFQEVLVGPLLFSQKDPAISLLTGLLPGVELDLVVIGTVDDLLQGVGARYLAQLKEEKDGISQPEELAGGLPSGEEEC
jgi:hypothetical protein